MTTASIRVRWKHANACSGVSTMGSFSLNDVLSRIGVPVRSANAEMSAW